MNYLSIFKGVAGLVTSTGVGNIVGNIIKVTTPANQNTFNKITTVVGGFVLSAMIADKTVEYLNEQIDAMFSDKVVVEATDESQNKHTV